MSGVLDLRTLQRWFATVVEHLATAEVAVRSTRARRLVALPALHAGKVLVPNPRMAATAQLQVYNGGYQVRLIEVLQGDFGGLRHVLGDDAFPALMARYLGKHPSRHANLNQLGQHVEAFVRAQRQLPNRAFLADLARLEWSLCRAFDVPEFAPVTNEQLQQVPADQWAQVRLQLNPSVQLVATRFPVGAWYRAWKEDQSPTIPGPERAWTLVFRRDDKVWRQRLERTQHALLAALAKGEVLGEAIEHSGGDARVGQWLQEFARDGLFADVVTKKVRSRRK